LNELNGIAVSFSKDWFDAGLVAAIFLPFPNRSKLVAQIGFLDLVEAKL